MNTQPSEKDPPSGQVPGSSRFRQRRCIRLFVLGVVIGALSGSFVTYYPSRWIGDQEVTACVGMGMLGLFFGVLLGIIGLMIDYINR